MTNERHVPPEVFAECKLAHDLAGCLAATVVAHKEHCGLFRADQIGCPICGGHVKTLEVLTALRPSP